jgi:hypothetical protein
MTRMFLSRNNFLYPPNALHDLPLTNRKVTPMLCFGSQESDWTFSMKMISPFFCEYLVTPFQLCVTELGGAQRLVS